MIPCLKKEKPEMEGEGEWGGQTGTVHFLCFPLDPYECGHCGMPGRLASGPLPDFLCDMDKLPNQAVV